RRPEDDIGSSERRCVGQIECFGAELHIHPLANVRSLDQREVGVAIRRPAHRVSRRIAQRELRRRHERRSNEELFGPTLRSRQLRIRQAIWALSAVAGESIEIRRLRYGERQPRLKSDYTGNFPAPQERSRPTFWIPQASWPEWQFRREAGD